MTEVNFAQQDPKEAAKVTTPEAQQQNTALATQSENFGMEGDNRLDDIRFPRLQITYGVGKLAVKYSQGDLVLGGEHLLVSKNVPLTVVIYKTNTYWKEWFGKDEFSDGIVPRTFKNPEEVRANGGTTSWGANGEKPTFSRAIDVKMFIRKPTDVVGGLFGLELDGNLYAPAEFTADKLAFKNIQPPILAAESFSLQKKGLRGGVWEINTTVSQDKGNTKVLPHIKLVGFNTEKFMVDLNALFVKPPTPEAG